MNKSELIRKVNTEHKAVAFTFDDGPDPAYTSELLDIFKSVSGKATFFMVGDQMKKYPELVRQVHEHGHEIGNHTLTHPYLSKLSADESMNEIAATALVAKELTGKLPATFRPPYLDYTKDIVTICKTIANRMIGAVNLDTEDWAAPGVDHIVKTSRKHLANGAILIYHDGFGDRSQTVEAVRILVKEAADQGYKLVTVTELLELGEAM
ncbi:polysaccharide deacetylase family protein [Paenibacillus thermotolerans]|uniref:polysaccharide deacetylase family protein n=1 Tax=Paenibacillus thermotolerans TaxID=3027807 RepID=UPI0023688C7B|nr:MULTISPECIES: polysaccharide deacetylase family protein [unclassified Paenibacillus]